MPISDVYGDETQDKCVGTAGGFNGCPNKFALGKPKGKKGKVKVTATVPGAGTLSAGSASDQALAKAAKSRRQLKRVTRNLTSTTKQKVTLTLKLTKAAQRKLAENGNLKAPRQGRLHAHRRPTRLQDREGKASGLRRSTPPG